MKKIYFCSIILIAFLMSDMLVAQPLMPDFHGAGGCSAECCWGRKSMFFFEDGACVYRSIDEYEDRITYFGIWKLDDSLVIINYTTKFYGKPVGNSFLDEERCSMSRSSLYIAQKEDIDLQETIHLKDLLSGTDQIFRNKHKYREEFSHYNFLTIEVNNEQQKIFSEHYLATLNNQELRLLRNDVFAKYGLIFKDKELKEYFEKKYYQNDCRYSDVSAYLNEYDKINIELIKRYEAKKEN